MRDLNKTTMKEVFPMVEVRAEKVKQLVMTHLNPYKLDVQYGAILDTSQAIELATPNEQMFRMAYVRAEEINKQTFDQLQIILFAWAGISDGVRQSWGNQ